MQWVDLSKSNKLLLILKLTPDVPATQWGSCKGCNIGCYLKSKEHFLRTVIDGFAGVKVGHALSLKGGTKFNNDRSIEDSEEEL